MGHTNSTVNYNLPQFTTSDKPSWLGDVNGAFLAIDTAIAAAKTEADSAAGGVAGLQTTVGSHTTQIGTLTETVTAQGGTLNSVTALIGNGTPTTTDQTIIGAINELHTDITENDLSSAVDISGYISADNPYTVPSDGYVRAYAESNGSIALQIMGSSNGGFSLIANCLTAPEVSDAVNVRKGMKVYVRGSSGSTSANFYALE